MIFEFVIGFLIIRFKREILNYLFNKYLYLVYIYYFVLGVGNIKINKK